jgi:hypothetical protein
MNKEFIFPEKNREVIGQILEKYGLKKFEDERMKKFIESIFDPRVTPEERMEISDTLPGKKLAKIVKDCAEEKLPLEKIPNRIKEDLNITLKDAEKMAKDIKTQILDLIQWVTTSKPGEKKETLATKIVKQKTDIKPLKENSVVKNKGDTYLEPIE